MKRFILLLAMVLMVLPAISQARSSSSRSKAGSKESEKKEVKSSENTRRAPASSVNSRSNRRETASPKGNAVNQSSGRRESAASRSGSAANQSSGKRENKARPGNAVNPSSDRQEAASGRSGNAVNQSSDRRQSATQRSGNSGNQSTGRSSNNTVTRTRSTAVNNSHSSGTYVYRHTYPRSVRTREVRIYRNVNIPAPIEVRRVNYVYRAPVRVEIYWSNRMYREYRSIYPFYNNWNYTYGSRILSIPAYDAYQHLGHFRSVYGRVHEVYYAPETDLYYLYFGAPYPYHDFSVVMSRREARRFSSSPEWFFQGQYIMVTGVIAMYDDKPEMEIVRRSQLVRY